MTEASARIGRNGHEIESERRPAEARLVIDAEMVIEAHSDSTVSHLRVRSVYPSESMALLRLVGGGCTSRKRTRGSCAPRPPNMAANSPAKDPIDTHSVVLCTGSKEPQPEMTGITKGQWSLDRLGELQTEERADRVGLSFGSSGAEPMKVDGAAEPAPDKDPDVLVMGIAF